MCQGPYHCTMRSIREWSREGLCRQQYNLFDSNNLRKSKRLCRTCPVASECLLYALIYREKGIWGATDDDQRDAMIRVNPEFRDQLIRQAKDQNLFEYRYTIARDYDFAAQLQAQSEFLRPQEEWNIR